MTPGGCSRLSEQCHRTPKTAPLDPAVLAGDWRVTAEPPGSLANLRAASRRLQPSLSRGEVSLAVSAVGLNFRDVLNVLGMYPGKPGPPGEMTLRKSAEHVDQVTQIMNIQRPAESQSRQGWTLWQGPIVHQSCAWFSRVVTKGVSRRVRLFRSVAGRHARAGQG